MTTSRANWHAIAAVSAVIIAECTGMKDETWQQVAAHGLFFWVCLLAAITFGLANSILSTKPGPGDPPITSTPVPLPPAAAPLTPKPEAPTLPSV